MVIKLDGNDDRLNCGNIPYLWSQGLTDFAFSIWVYINRANQTDKYIFTHGGASNHGKRLIIRSDGSVDWQIKNSVGTNIAASSNAPIPIKKWTHFLCTYDASAGSDNIKLWVDGVLQTSQPELTETINVSADLRIGETVGNAPEIYVKDFRFWKNDTTGMNWQADKAAALFAGTDEDNYIPDFWLPMDEGTGDPESYGLKGILNDNVQWDHNSAYFNGINADIAFGNETTLWASSQTKFSYTFWTKLREVAITQTYRTIIAFGGTTALTTCYQFSGDPKRIAFDVDTPTAYSSHISKVDDVKTIDRWYHIACVYDSALGSERTKIYVDGVKGVVDVEANPSTFNDPAATFNIGNSEAYGNVKQFRYWKGIALTSSEVNLIKNGNEDVVIAPHFSVDLDESKGIITKDSVTNHLEGVRENGADWAFNTKNTRYNVQFDGSNDFIDLTNDASLWSQSLTKFSFSFWAYPTTNSGSIVRDVVNHGTGASNGFRCIQFNNDMAWKINFGAGESNIFGNYGTINTWNHFVCTYDSTLGSNQQKIYKNGTLLAQGESGHGAINLSDAAQLAGGGTDFKGNLRDFRFWKSKALTALEVVTVFYDDPSAPSPDYWLKMDEGTGNAIDFISDSKVGTLTNGAFWSSEVFPTVTSDPSYNLPLNMKLVIKSNDEKQTYFRYDSYGQKPFKVAGLQLTLGDSETDLSLLLIEDSDDVLNNDHLSGGIKYFISLAAGETVPYEDLFVGYGEVMDIIVEARNKIYKAITIFGSKIVATYRYLNYFRAAKLNELQDPERASGSEFSSRAHVDRAIDHESELLYDKIIISDRAGWDDIDLSKDVSTIIGGIALGTVNLWDFMEFNRSITGAAWGVELRKQKERFYYQFPELDRTDIILKSGYEINRSTDLATKTSWIFPPFTYTKDTSRDVNHADILHGITDTDDVFIAGFSDSSGNDNLTFKALAQSLPLPADARRIKNVHLKLSMKGEVTSPENKVNGKLCLSDSAGKPLGTTLDKFEIPLGDIDEDPKVVSVTVDVDPEKIKGDTEIWIVLYQRSGTEEEDKGEPNHDEKNTILWHHNNKTNSSTPLQKSATAPEGNRHDEPLKWSTTTKGPVYACSLSSDIQRMQTMMTPQLFGQYGVKEVVLNVSDLRDRTSVNAYLAFKSFMLSLPKTYISTLRAKTPNGFFFRPNQILFMGVAKPRINQMQRIKRVTYNIPTRDQERGENQSSRIATLSLEGSYNPADYQTYNCDL